MRVVTLTEARDGRWLVGDGDATYHRCANDVDFAVCNWLVSETPQKFCRACQFNRTVPDLSVGGNLELWRDFEMEKRRLIYSLAQFQLPLETRLERKDGLAFDFLSRPLRPDGSNSDVVTGHARGVITLNIFEADDAHREQIRSEMNEPYRTVLGHLRHESGHYFWDRLIRDTPWLASFREMFGDERADYVKALQAHYAQGPSVDWNREYVSRYAASHPWEDWAETWAHLLHIVDTMDTAYRLGIRVNSSRFGLESGLDAVGEGPYQGRDFQALARGWAPLALTLNCLNRSVGHGHVYPFVLTERVIQKLEFVFQVIDANRSGAR